MNFKSLYAILLVMITITDRQGSAEVNPLDTENGYRIERIDEVIPRYEKAEENCKENTGITYFRQGWLVRIKDGIMQKHVENITSGTSNDYFIGLQYDDSAWYWNDGTHLTNENWAMNEGDGTDENCARIRGNNGEWFDVPCDTPSTYICQSDLIYIEVKAENITAEEGETIELEAVFATQQDPVVTNLYKAPNMETSLANDTTTQGSIKQFKHQIKGLATKDQGEYVFVLTTQDGETKYNRTGKTKVSVHIPANITDVEPSSICSPVTTGPDSVTCVAEGTPPPTVNWKKSSEVVTTDETMNGVYQTIEGLKAILHVEYAALTDHGVYTCEATNYVTADEFQRKDSENITLSVLGPPMIFNVSGNNCGEPSSITVIWKPNENTRNTNHSVEVMVASNSSNVCKMMINPNGQETVTTHISEGLNEDTIYTVMITVCPDLCIENLNDTADVKTAGSQANPVTNCTLRQIKETCVISWEWGDSYSNNEVSFVIRETAAFVSNSNVNENKTVNLAAADCNENGLECNAQHYSTRRMTKPNRNYTYTVASKTCSGESETVNAVGTCATEYAVSDNNYILPPSPLEQKKGCQPINITVPDETNGPISCIFVVMVAGENLTLTTNFNESTLENLSNEATDGVPQNEVEYLAFAIARSKINESGLIVNLGDEQNTTCNPENVVGYSASAMVDYSARNWNLQINVNYTYYTLSSTPYWTKEGIALQRSNATSFQILGSKTRNEPNIPAIVGGTFGGAGGILIIMGSIYYWKSKSKSTKQKETTATPQNEENVSDNIPAIVKYEGTNSKPLKASNNPAYKHDPPPPGIKPQSNSSTTIYKQQTRQKFEELNKNKGKEFETQFKEINRNAAALTLSTDIASDDTRKQKNRYKNVLPYDNTRVKLKGTVQDDYINACYINGHHALNKFIATQGPTDATIEDFWKMVAGERTKVIVMLTNVVEAGKRKCEKYWPDISQDFTKYGDVGVMNTKETYYGGFMKRTFKIQTPDVRHDRTVEQLQYLKWPDHGIPVTTSSFVRLHKECVKCQAGADVPIIVHCSAGAGRTGTFIGYDYLLEELGANGDFDVYNCVTKMREQRMDMVQTCGQYKLMHRLLLEEVMFGNTDSDESDFNSKFPSDERTQKILAHEEFKKVEEASSIPKILENEVKDFEVIIRWYPEEGENIARYDAAYVENYYNEKKVIAARSPVNEHDRELFWRVVLDHEVKYIVMLDTKKPVPYWPQQNGEWVKLGKITVGLTESHDHRHMIERRFGVTREGIEQEVVQYQMVKWSPDVIKNTIEKVTGAVNTAMRSRSKVVVHCCNGRGRTGTFCASINLLERLSKENHVDVFRAVKDLRDCRDGMVQNESQYRMCYKTIAHSMNTKAAATYAGLGDEASQGTSMIQDERQNREAYENHSVYSKKSTTKV